MDVFVLIEWLVGEFGVFDLCVVDVIWFLDVSWDVVVEYEVEYIFGVVFMDLVVFVDEKIELLMMLFSVEKFVSCMQLLGFGDGS